MSKFSRLLTAAALLAIPLLTLLPQEASACMAVNSPNLRIIRTPGVLQKDGREHATAFFSEYDCFAMTPKTYCAIGVRFDPAAEAVKATDIKVHSMKFVLQENGKSLTGFDPVANEVTTKSLTGKKAGMWYGFSGLFKKKTQLRGGVEVKLDISIAPGTTDEQLKAAFAQADVAASGGDKSGALIGGHHQEIIEVGKVFIVGAQDQKPSGAPEPKK